MISLISAIYETINEYYRTQGAVYSKQEIIDLIEVKFRIGKIKRSLYSDADNNVILRFMWSKFDGLTPANTYLSVKTIVSYDHLPILAIMIRPHRFDVSLGNTSFIDKVSHSSKGVAIEADGSYTLSGSVNYNNIVLENNDFRNIAENWKFHIAENQDENIRRIINKTLKIAGHKVSKIVLTDNEIYEFVSRTTDIHNSCFFEIRRCVETLFNRHAIEVENIFDFEKSAKVRGEKIQSLMTGVEDNDHEFSDMYYEILGSSILFNIKTIDLTLEGGESSPQAFNIDKLINNIDYDDAFSFYFLIIVKSVRGIEFQTVNFLDIDVIDYYGTAITHWSGIGTRGHMQIRGISKLIDLLRGKNSSFIEENKALNFIKLLNSL